VQPYPHLYEVRARAEPRGRVRLFAEGLPELLSDSSRAHGGPGDAWSPGALLVAAAVDCYALSFRLSAAASRLEFLELECRAEGAIDRAPEGGARLVRLVLHAYLAIPSSERPARAERLLHKAEENCLVTRSLRAPVELRLAIDVR
jgi:organic hydroperoxide reductase OsmC/OhrA